MLIALFTALGLVAAPPLVQGAPAEPTATLLVVHPPGRGDLVDVQGNTTFTVFQNETCEGRTARAAKTVIVHSQPQDWGQLTIPAGRTVYIHGRSQARVYGLNVTCPTVVSFVPEAGRTYRMSQELRNAGCVPVLTDDATQASPPTMRRIQPQGRCRR